MKRNTAVIDLHGCNYLGEIHGRIKSALNFPAHYGENWSAFWDFLSFDTPVEYIVITGEYTLPSELKKHLDKMHEILVRCKEERQARGHKFDYVIID